MPKHPLISIPLDIPDVRVLQTEMSKAGELILTEDESMREMIIEELDVIKEINDGNDQKRQIIPKGGVGKEDENSETIHNLLGRSPDFGDGLMMRMYFEVAKTPEPGMRWL